LSFQSDIYTIALSFTANFCSTFLGIGLYFYILNRNERSRKKREERERRLDVLEKLRANLAHIQPTLIDITTERLQDPNYCATLRIDSWNSVIGSLAFLHLPSNEYNRFRVVWNVIEEIQESRTDDAKLGLLYETLQHMIVDVAREYGWQLGTH
jgi:hypothetical protein